MDHASQVPVAVSPIPYRSLPGPKRLPLLGNAHLVQVDKFHQQLEAWAREYGGKFRFQITSRKFMAITDPEAIATVLRQRPQVFRKGPRLVQVARDLAFHGVFTANDDAWRRQRQLVMPALDPAHLRSYLPALVAVTRRLHSRWMHKAQRGEPVELLVDLMRYTVDVTTSLAFGEDLNTIEQGEDTAIQRHLNFIFPKLAQRNFAPFDIEHWIKDKQTVEHVAALRTAVQGFIANTRRLLAERPELRQHPENLIQSLVATRDAGRDLTDEDVSGNVLTMLLAGEDTTANTLAWMVWLLSRHPEALERARAEAIAALDGEPLPTALEPLGRMDYLEACANEAMRLKPVAPLNILQAGEDVVVDGVLLPKGSFVMCLMRPAGMDPARFDAPESFRPERWLDPAAAGEGRMFSAKRVVMPFGGGPRLCPGRYLALAEIKMLASMLLANFQLQVDCPSGEPVERLYLTMSPVGLTMLLKPRAVPVA